MYTAAFSFIPMFLCSRIHSRFPRIFFFFCWCFFVCVSVFVSGAEYSFDARHETKYVQFFGFRRVVVATGNSSERNVYFVAWMRFFSGRRWCAFARNYDFAIYTFYSLLYFYWHRMTSNVMHNGCMHSLHVFRWFPSLVIRQVCMYQEVNHQFCHTAFFSSLFICWSFPRLVPRNWTVLVLRLHWWILIKASAQHILVSFKN